jgi:hypothetical protein
MTQRRILCLTPRMVGTDVIIKSHDYWKSRSQRSLRLKRGNGLKNET